MRNDSMDFTSKQWTILNDPSHDRLRIELNDETYRCTWTNTEDLITHHGIGIVLDNNLIIAKTTPDNLDTDGGVGTYQLMADGRSHAILWAAIVSPNKIKSGIAIRDVADTCYAGEYVVRYFPSKDDFVELEVKIIETVTRDLYELEWYKKGKKMQHGIGIMNGNNMAIAWGTVDCNWELIICDLDEMKKKSEITVQR